MAQLENINSTIKDIVTVSEALINAETIPVAVNGKPSTLMESALESDFNSDTELKAKKAISTALLIAKKKNLLPEGVPSSIDGIYAATLVDDIFTRMKVAYQTANGNIDIYEASDIMIDKATTRVLAVSDIMVAKGVDFAINKVGMTIAKAFPPALPIIAAVKCIQPFITEKAQQFVKTGIQKLSSFAKTAVRKVGEFIKNKAKNFVKSLFA